jgi:hypothetical protein
LRQTRGDLKTGRRISPFRGDGKAPGARHLPEQRESRIAAQPVVVVMQSFFRSASRNQCGWMGVWQGG